MIEGHIYKVFDEELRELKEKILFEGSLVEKAVRNAIKALQSRDSELARRVIEDDDLINTKEVEIEEFCIKLLALRQPAAKDLRFITTAVKINYDLERMGDMAVNVCERVLDLNLEPQLKPYIDLPEDGRDCPDDGQGIPRSLCKGRRTACVEGDERRRKGGPAYGADIPGAADLHVGRPENHIPGHEAALYRQIS